MGLINIFKLQEPPDGLLGIWELSESCETLLTRFNFRENEKQEFDKISAEKRKCEFLAVRILLREMMQNKNLLLYDDVGKPYLEEDCHISISHSSELAVILISDKPAGIDVENMHRNTEKIARRFLSEKELHQVNITPDPAFTRIIYWCAKEALYKCIPLTGIDFKNHIEIRPFLPEPGHGSFYGQLHKNNRTVDFKFHYFISHNNAVVYCREIDKEPAV